MQREQHLLLRSTDECSVVAMECTPDRDLLLIQIPVAKMKRSQCYKKVNTSEKFFPASKMKRSIVDSTVQREQHLLLSECSVIAMECTPDRDLLLIQIPVANIIQACFRGCL